MTDLPQALQVAAGRWLEPLAAASRDSAYRRDLFAALGLDADGFDDNGVARLAAELGEAADALDALVEIDLKEASLQTLALVLQAAQRGVAAAEAAAAVAADLDDSVGDALAVLDRLFGFLTVGYLASYSPATYDVAVLLTLIRADERSDGGLPRLELSRLPAIVEDPGLLAREYIGPGGLDALNTSADAIAAADRLLPRVAAVARRGGVNARYSRDIRRPLPADPGVADRRLTVELPLGAGVGVGLILSLRSAEEGGAGIVVAPFGAVRVERDGLGWTFSLDVEGSVRGLVVGPAGVEFPSGTPVPRVETRAGAVKRPGPGGVAFRTSASGNRLEIGGLGVRAGAVFASDFEIEVLADMRDAALVMTGGDGLLDQLLPPGGLRVEFELGVGWSRRRGLFFAGGASLDAVLGVHRSLGPLRIELIHLSARAREGGLTGTLATTCALTIGPVAAEVERTGIAATLTFPRAGGNLGPANLTIDFKAPTGIGLSIDSGAVTGGGFLEFNEEQAQYAGALHLQFEDVSVNAIGILSTRLPGGQPGYSLVILVQASGFAPVHLGFGFSLTGVGGLLGVNRGVNVEVLRAGVRSRALDPILFTKDDPVPRAGEIVSALQNVFPPTPDSHVFGPMAQITWGTPALLTIEIALLLQLPAPLRLIILGRIKARLPDEDTPLVRINLDALGVVDFDRREASVDAALYDSNLFEFALTGEMALRASWGENPQFALAVGGFHPRFLAPPGFPQLGRLALTLASGDNPRLRMEAYLALTSNTVQFGSRLDFFFKADQLSLEGMLGFDTLINLSPFGFTADIVGTLVLKWGSDVLFGVWVVMALSGPNPWHARGRATFDLLGWKQSIEFNTTFGERVELPEPELVDIGGLLQKEIEKPTSWSAQLPTGGQAATLGASPQDGAVLVHPGGELAVSQRIVPLDCEISIFGTSIPAKERSFSLSVLVGDGFQSKPVYDHFARGQFWRLSDDERLAAPSFDRMPAGVRAGGAYKTGKGVSADIVYETKIVALDGAGPPAPEPPPESYVLPADRLEPLAQTGAAGLAAVTRTGRAKYRGEQLGVALADTEYVIAKSNLDQVAGTEVTGGSYSAAAEALRDYAASHPGEELQIVARYEVAGVA